MNSRDKGPNVLGIPWQILFIYAIRNILLLRNQKVFLNSSIPITSTKRLISSQAADFLSSIDSFGNSNPYPTPSVPSNLKWEKPRNGWCKVNVDNSTKDNLMAAGGVIRS